MEDEEVNKVVNELDDELNKIAERLRQIDDDHKYMHVLEGLIRKMLGYATDPEEEGTKCATITLATVRQAIGRMTAEITGYPNSMEEKEDLEYIA